MDIDTEFRILVVEDIVANQEVACAILEHAGYVADVAGDGKEAIKALKSKPYDLVLMDCCMPVMDGFAATRSIRAADSRVLNPEIPIIALTALAMSGDREKCLEAGMDDYVAKPVNPAKLVNVIERLKTDLEQASAGLRGDVAKAVSFEWPPGLLETIIGLFLEDAPLQIAELQAALQSGDCDRLQAVSHKIRGSSDILGTTSLSTLARAVEEAAKRGNFEQLSEIVPKLVAELQRLLTDLSSVDGQEPG